MTVESATYLSDLSTSNPAASDQKAEGDDHIRLLKTVLKTTFPNITGAVTPTQTQLNYVSGVTSAIQTQLDAKAPAASPAFTGTVTAANGAFSGTFSIGSTLAVTGVVTLSTYAAGVTEAAGSNNTRLATTEFVQAAVAGAVGGASRAEMFFYGSF